MVMRYLPGEAPGHQGTTLTRRRRTRSAPSSDSADEAADRDLEAAALNVSLADSVRAGAPGDGASDDEDEEDFVNEGRSDTDEEMDEPEDVEDWVDEDGDLGPEDGEVNEDDGYDDRYAPL